MFFFSLNECILKFRIFIVVKKGFIAKIQMPAAMVGWRGDAVVVRTEGALFSFPFVACETLFTFSSHHFRSYIVWPNNI